MGIVTGGGGEIPLPLDLGGWGGQLNSPWVAGVGIATGGEGRNPLPLEGWAGVGVVKPNSP